MLCTYITYLLRFLDESQGTLVTRVKIPLYYPVSRILHSYTHDKLIKTQIRGPPRPGGDGHGARTSVLPDLLPQTSDQDVSSFNKDFPKLYIPQFLKCMKNGVFACEFYY